MHNAQFLYNSRQLLSDSTVLVEKEKKMAYYNPIPLCAEQNVEKC